MRFRIRTYRRKRITGKRRTKRGGALPYSKNGKVYYGRGVISKIVANLVSKLGDSLLGI